MRSGCKPLAATALAVAIAALLAACGGGSDSDATGGGAATGDAGGETTAVQATGDQPELTQGADPVDDLRIGIADRVTELDPLLTGSPALGSIGHLTSGTLFRFVGVGDDVEPALAESGRLSDDAMTYTVKLKPDLVFSDGSELTVEDVKASFDRGRTKDGGYRSFFAPIKQVTIVDDRTVEFRFKSRYLSFENFLAYPAAGIFPARGIADDTAFFKTQPVTSGPYKVVTPPNGATFRLERDDGYAGPKPVARAVTFVTVEDPNSRVAQLRSGQLDYISSPPLQQFKSLTGDVTPIARSGYATTYLGLNNTRAPFDDVRVRRAAALAVDRAQVQKVAWQGIVARNDGALPTIFDGYEAVLPEPDVEAAKAELKGTACESGCPVTLLIAAGDDWPQAAAVIIKSNLEAIGMKVTIESGDPVATLDRKRSLEYVAMPTFVGSFSSIPEGYPSNALYSKGSFLSAYTGYRSAQMDRAIEASILARTPAERRAAYERAGDIFGRDVPFVTLTDFPVTAAVRTELKNTVTPSSTVFIEIATE